MSKFEAGQRVKFTGMVMPATIISGPHPTEGADRWLIRKADENVSLVRERELTAVMDRRTAVAKALFERTGYGRWEDASGPSRGGYLSMADAALAAADAHVDEAAPLAAGDKIRILSHRLHGAQVDVGDVLTVMSIGLADLDGEVGFQTNGPRSPLGGMWHFLLSDEGTGWERA